MPVRRFKGDIIFWTRDEYGEILVVDAGKVRSLYFGDGVLQSNIIPGQPETLIEDYNQAIMGALMFMNEPRSVLLIGLGGCTLVNYLLSEFPLCRVDAVEIRQKVIDLAQEFFLLPGEHSN